jgi:Bacterial lectin
MKIFELTPRRIAPLVLLCGFVWLGSPSLHAQDFKYQNFTATEGNIPELSLNGNAAPATSNGLNVLRITPASTFQVGSTWFCGSDCSLGTGKQFLAQGFSTTFKFQLSGNNTEPEFGPADGFAFVIQNGCFSEDPDCGINALDPTAGGTHGYDGLTNSLAVEFVTFCNGPDHDICDSINTANNGTSSANEVGIQSCGTNPNTANTAANDGPDESSCNFGRLDLASLFSSGGTSASTTVGSKTVTLTTGETPYSAAQMQNMVGLSFVINGLDFGLITATNATNQTLTLATAAPSTQATGNYAIEPVLADGNVHTVTITNTPTQAPSCVEEVCSAPSLLTVTLDGNLVLSTPIDIVGFVLGGTDGALVGFTGSSADGDDNQDILSWSYDTAQTNIVGPTGAGTAFYGFDDDDDTWLFSYVGLPAGAQLTGFRTETTQAEWAQRVAGTSYQGTTLAPILAPGFIATGDGAVFSLFCSFNGMECTPNPAQPYTYTAQWNSSDPKYPSENPGLLKTHPSDTNDWVDTFLLSFNAPPPSEFDPLPTNKGGSKTPCSDYANVSGVKGTPPTVTITTPADGATYVQGQVVDAIFTCAGNFVTGCVGAQDPNAVNTPLNGLFPFTPIDTSVGGTAHAVSVIADVSSGPSGTASATYYVSAALGKYGVQLLYAPNRVVKSGADFPIKMYLTNSSGMDVSSPTLIVNALQVILVSTNMTDTVTETGGSNPDLDFRFDGTQGPTGGYIFNLKTTGLPTGQYVLQFKVQGDAPNATYAVPFGVR